MARGKEEERLNLIISQREERKRLYTFLPFYYRGAHREEKRFQKGERELNKDGELGISEPVGHLCLCPFPFVC